MGGPRAEPAWLYLQALCPAAAVGGWPPKSCRSIGPDQRFVAKPKVVGGELMPGEANLVCLAFYFTSLGNVYCS